uniref:X-ray repair cross-complementing protein 5 n=1 Tax=Ciona intestinalis TaxID=7719 RepID=UPI00005255A0|nr:X-ray repair cross-complementing protein 5 [Ciona intestinalis]|eukprot:XP_002122561.2 X-ray repair cross-complementing protein 5 [Ciona intestinalis]
MSAHIYSDDVSDNENEAEVFEQSYGGRESVVFAIECCEEMFDINQEDEESYFERIMTSIHDMLVNKIITSDTDMNGIVFFGVENKTEDGKFPGVRTWQQFDVPCVKSIMELREIQNIDFKQFENKFGKLAEYEVSNVLWASHQLFLNCPFKLANKTLVVFPWNENPHKGNNNAVKRARAKCGDLHEHGVEIQVFSFNQDFSYEPFYKHITTDQIQSNEQMMNPINAISNLYSFLMRKCYKQRMTRTRLQIGKYKISVGVYTVARKTTKTSAVWIDNSTNKIVKRQINLVDTSTGEMLMPSDVKLYQTWAGKDIVFEKEEVTSMKQLCDVGITVLGFQPRVSTIKPWYHSRPAQFIYPDDSDLKGSSTFFTALLQKCLDKDYVAICRFVPRTSASMRNIALLPQREEIDPETSEQIKPSGFFIVYLPFADDVRETELPEEQPSPSEEQVQSAESIIRKLRFKYDPNSFDNPALQTHYKNLEAMALEKEAPDPVTDHTAPDVERIDRKVGPLVETFKSLVFPQNYDPTKTATKHKSNQTTRESKRAKTENAEVNIQEAVNNNALGKYTVVQLKEICRELEVKCTGKKADLISAITAYYE